MKKILVTGSNGYIGKHTVKYLQKAGYYVVGLDMVDQGVNLGDEFIHMNIQRSGLIEGEYDTVIHLAALVQVGGGQKSMMEYYRTNVVGTMNMLENVTYKKFIFASTCQASYRTHVYGQSKFCAEGIVTQYCELNNKDYTIFRFGNVVGTDGFEPTNTDGLLYNLMKARETGVFNLYGDDYDTKDGSAERDYIHVNEICFALEKAISEPASYTVPLAHGEFYTVKECIDAFKKANHCDFRVVVKPRREGDPDEFYELWPDADYLPDTHFTLEEMMTI